MGGALAGTSPGTSITAETGSGWALLRLSAPSGLVRLDSDSLLAVIAAVEARLADPALSLLALTGSGGSFAVGADLSEIALLTPTNARDLSLLGARLFSALEGSRAVVIAAIDGWCLGGGLDLALACDWRMATERSSFSHPGPALGIITGWGGTQRLPRLVGHRRAAGTLLAARRYGAAEAHAMGLVQELVADGAMEEALRTRIPAFLGLPSDLLTFLKRRS